MFCVMCRAENPDHAGYCWKCGAELVRTGAVSDVPEIATGTPAQTGEPVPSNQTTVEIAAGEPGQASEPAPSNQPTVVGGQPVGPSIEGAAAPASGQHISSQSSVLPTSSPKKRDDNLTAYRFIAVILGVLMLVQVYHSPPPSSYFDRDPTALYALGELIVVLIETLVGIWMLLFGLTRRHVGWIMLVAGASLWLVLYYQSQIGITPDRFGSTIHNVLRAICGSAVYCSCVAA